MEASIKDDVRIRDACRLRVNEFQVSYHVLLLPEAKVNIMMAFGEPTWPGEQIFAFPLAVIAAGLYLIWRIRSLHRGSEASKRKNHSQDE